jgi:hypothetical protein
LWCDVRVAVKVEAAGEEDVWSQPQQKQLEAGLVKFPASMDKNERWKSIADVRCVH